jgi:hypothetical protein
MISDGAIDYRCEDTKTGKKIGELKAYIGAIR